MILKVQAILCIFGFTLGLTPSPAIASTPTITNNHKVVKWFFPNLNLVGNPRNTSGVSDAAFRGSVVKGLQRWTESTQGLLHFDYWQGTDESMYEPNSEYNGHSSVFFASNKNLGTSALPYNVIALTQVWYDSGSAEISEADIILNDINYQFTNTPTDSSGYGAGQSTLGKKVYVENVLTHEIGHAFGLSHSGNLQSTMFFMEAPDQAHLSCDDRTGIRGMYYGAAGGASGSLSGRVLLPNGAAVFGAQVSAISLRRGVVLGSAISDFMGNYTIGGLEPGSYSVYAEPYYAGASALPTAYSSISANLCGGGEYSRTFLVEGDSHTLRQTNVLSGKNVQAANLNLSCSNGNASISSVLASTVATSAPNLEVNGTQALVDRIDGSGSSFYYLLHVTQGHLEVHGLAHSLFSPVRVDLELLDENGNTLSQTINTTQPSYQSESGFSNYDSQLSVSGLPPGYYRLKVTGHSLGNSYFPGGSLAVDGTSFFVLTASTQSGNPTQDSVYPVHAKCRSPENFDAYTSPPGDPPRGRGAGFCGTIERDDGRPPPVQPGSVIFSWLLPWFAMLGMGRLIAIAVRIKLRSQKMLVN